MVMIDKEKTKIKKAREAAGEGLGTPVPATPASGKGKKVSYRPYFGLREWLIALSVC